MPRKSRRIKVNETRENPQGQARPQKEGKRIPTALYARLSIENNGREDEESIGNQIALIHSYVLENSDKYELVDTYVDNGYSGTNFERPEFMRMMEDVNRGRIGCIVVKDLSRFGRNYVETGVYVENVFPKLQVRLIAVNDNFDSSREADRESMSVPVKNMVNEMYARDQSRKMMTANAVRRMDPRTLPMGPCPFGYQRDKENARMVTDENARYVKVIFLWAVLGVTKSEIADRLNLIGAPGPCHCSRKNAGYGKWTNPGIRMIIQNPTYVGDVCLGKSRRTRVGTGKGAIQVPRDQWVVHEDRHEALVPRPDFDVIWERKIKNSEAMAGKLAGSAEKRESLKADFKNLVYCGECEKKMVPRRACYKAGEKYTHVRYECVAKRKTEKCCHGHVTNDFLKVFVAEQVRAHVLLLTEKAKVIREIREAGNGRDLRLSIDKRIASASVRLEEARQRKAKTYEDFKAGIIEEDDFKLVHEKMVSEVQALEENLRALNAKKDGYVRAINNYLTLMEDLRDARKARNLTRP